MSGSVRMDGEAQQKAIQDLLQALAPFAHQMFYKIEGRDWERARDTYERLAPPHYHPGDADDAGVIPTTT